MKILIIEDDFSIALDIELFLRDMGYKDIGIREDAESALGFLKGEGADLLIIDLDLTGEHSGIDIARTLIHPNNLIIFITAQNDEATFKEAMLANPSGFLIKPFDKITLQSYIDNALKRQLEILRSKQIDRILIEDWFFIKQKNILKKIDFSDILWIEADGNYVEVHLNQKRYATKLSLKKIEKEMNVSYFIRVHKKFLINLKKVDKVISSSELLMNGNRIPVGPKYREDLLQTIQLGNYC